MFDVTLTRHEKRQNVSFFSMTSELSTETTEALIVGGVATGVLEVGELESPPHAEKRMAVRMEMVVLAFILTSFL